MAIKSNRVVALSADDKAKGKFTGIEFLELEGIHDSLLQTGKA